MNDKRKGYTARRIPEIERIKLFLVLWHSNHPYDICMEIVNKTFPPEKRCPEETEDHMEVVDNVGQWAT